ncbi:MAG: T9SS type A sorting domain-containing protein [Chitinophagaceae bacterium]|nr:T9SS type A sorting domain-containing protein [Chitinophagaceae bacterium]
MEGKGSTTVNTYYQFLDTNPADGINYYKLRQVDYSNHWTESEVIRINSTNNPGNNSLIATQRGGQTELRFKTATAGKAIVSLLDINGRVLVRKTVGTTVGINVVNLGVYNMPSGIYVGAVTLDGHTLKVRFKK